jgi:glycosyltransferase involved in cell wall biosynthesis
MPNRLKIGFISTTFPEDLETSVVGVFKRMNMFIQAMKGEGDLDMLFYVRPELDLNNQFLSEIEDKLSKHWDAQLRMDLCNSEPVLPAKGRWQEYIRPALSIANFPPYLKTAQKKQIDAAKRMLSRKPDILFIHRLQSMIPILLSGCDHPKVYFDMDDIEHVAFSRSVKQPPWWPGKKLLYLRLPILKLWERRAIRLSKSTFICSEQDRKYLSKAYGTNNVTVIPNAIDIPRKQEIPDEQKLLFLGPMSYPPNKVAADYLIGTIWPTILAALPDARLLIAGAYPERISSFAESPPGVEFLGFVDDLEKLYKKVRVVCCPILAAGGTRIKILEAAAYGKPVVSTTIGAEGIGLEDEKGILLRDDPKSFAEACMRLLKDKNYAVKIAHAARSVVVQQYDKNNVVDRIRMYITESGGNSD